MRWIKQIKEGLFGGHPKWPAGRFGEIKAQKHIYCLFYNEWIGSIVPCMEICDDRGKYLEQILKKLPADINRRDDFLRAAQNAGFQLPQDLEKAVKSCLFCEAHSGDGVEEIPPAELIEIDELLKILYG